MAKVMAKVMSKLNYKKATQALNRFALKEGGRINKMKAYKLIYFADRYHLRKYGRLITNDDYVAMDNGAVPSQTRDMTERTTWIGDTEKDYAGTYLKNDGKYDLKSKSAPDNDVFSDSDIEALEFAWEKFGSLDQYQLGKLTHNYPEWNDHEKELKSKPRSRFPMDINRFFDDPITNTDCCFTLNSEDKKLKQEHLQEIIDIENIWR
jgi:uncharacterized phage-associated protein